MLSLVSHPLTAFYGGVGVGVAPKLRRLAVQTNVDNATTQRQYLVVDGYEALLLALTPYESKKTIASFFRC